MSSEQAILTKLDNGLRVVTHRTPGASSVEITVKVMAGARDEVVGNYPRGTAHFLEHMLGCGSEKYPGFTRRLIEDGAGAYNVAVEHPYTTCDVTVKPAQLTFQ